MGFHHGHSPGEISDFLHTTPGLVIFLLILAVSILAAVWYLRRQ